MSKNLSAKYFQENKERYQSLSKEEKEKSDNMVVNVTKTSQKVKKINWLSIETNITEWEKIIYYNYKKYFSVEKIIL